MENSEPTLCDTCSLADVSCPVYPRVTITCVEYTEIIMKKTSLFKCLCCGDVHEIESDSKSVISANCPNCSWKVRSEPDDDTAGWRKHEYCSFIE
jgi:hypothetical protein